MLSLHYVLNNKYLYNYCKVLHPYMVTLYACDHAKVITIHSAALPTFMV